MRPNPAPIRRRAHRAAWVLIALAAHAAGQSAPAPEPVTEPVPVTAPAPAPAPALPTQTQPQSQPRSSAPPGLSREQMWFAPTAEDWQRPCLVRWQRTWEDAQAVAKETGRAILVCVNMDGEVASEHYAGVRYRQPETAALYEPYVCVIASVYRHTPRDHDEQGRRVLCPRFGSVTCGEHIAIEPVLYEQYFEGERVAPRHIGVELEGAAAQSRPEMFDVYYAWDTDTIFNTLRQGIANRKTPERPPVRGDLSLPELVAQSDAQRREELEALYARGDRDLRRTLLEAALALGGAAPIELLRLAVFGGDAELSGLARRALMQSSSPAASDVIIEALDLPMAQAEQQMLVEALARLGADSPRARTIAQARAGLAGPSTVDVAGWSQALSAQAASQASYAAAALAPARVAQLASQDQILASADGPAHLDLAEALLALAESEPDAQSARWLYLDAQATAQQAESLGASGPRSNSVLALAALSLGETDEARRRIDAGVTSIATVPESRGAMQMLELFAQSRQEAIAQAVRERKEWPSQWLADVDAAYSVLVQHPDGTDRQALMHYDFVCWFGAASRAERILDEGLARFPGSADLHDRLRGQVLRVRGAHGLEAEYERRLSDAASVTPAPSPEALAELESFAGYASLVAAETQRRGGRPDEAQAAYDRALRHYERSQAGDPERGAAGDHYIALALAGRARLALERGDEARALDELLSCFARQPESVATADGLNVTAMDTARMLRGRLARPGQQELLAVLDTALSQLDPALLALPSYERSEPGER